MTGPPPSSLLLLLVRIRAPLCCAKAPPTSFRTEVRCSSAPAGARHGVQGGRGTSWRARQRYAPNSGAPSFGLLPLQRHEALAHRAVSTQVLVAWSRKAEAIEGDTMGGAGAPLAALAACQIVRTAAAAAFSSKKRAMVAGDVIDHLGAAVDALYPC